MKTPSTLLKGLITSLVMCLFVFFNTLNAQQDTSKKSNDLYDMDLETLMNFKVISASQIEEPIKETPVPVTIITDEMIVKSGAKNLRDLLILYVPGITLVQDHNEMNFAMRGVYASSQQKILILLDGHRLNSRSYSESNPDYSISLEKIKQIEVLRGPASSLYGNVALTAVVNIITKSGEDVSGGSVQVSAGNYGQQKIAVLIGQKFNENSDFLFWSNYYRADGQKIAIDAANDYSAHPKDGYAIIDGVKDLPSYDVGFKYNTKKFSLLGFTSYCKYVEPYTAGGATGEVYNYDEYRTLLGIGPGLGSKKAGLDAKYNIDLGTGYNLSINGYGDYNGVEVLLVSNPFTKSFGAPSWKEISFGEIVQLNKKYDLGIIGKGNFLIGNNIDYMNVFDSYYPVGTNGELSGFGDSTKGRVLEIGSEIIYSGFVQIKHNINDKWILNLGGRFDEKDRHKGDNINNFSPRVALIFLPTNTFNVKLSYANSFVDAPYWYRYNSLASYKGSSNLLPEKLSSIQLTPTVFLYNKKMSYSLNCFYNNLTNFIYRDLAAVGDAPRYKNAGNLKSYGIENEILFANKFLKVTGVVTYQSALEAKDYGVKDDQINNIPNFTGNLILDVNPLYSLYKDLWFNISYRYVGEQISPIPAGSFLNGIAYENAGNTVSAVSLINTGIRVENLYKFTIDARVYNVLDTKYFQGGSTRFPYQQAGRWYLFTLGYKF